MKYWLATLTLIFATTFAGTRTFGQGCSDAGICTTGIMAMDDLSEEQQKKFRLGLGYNIGKGDAGTMVNTLLLEGNFNLSSKLFLQFKIPYLMTDGNLGKTNGLGDITLSINGIISQSGDHRFEGFAGFRIGTGKADLSADGMPLPMVYQTSLGTTDLLLGAKWIYKGWSASLGYQQPLIQNNENQFLYSAWEGNEDANGYSQSRELTRKSDIMARAEKAFYINDLTISIGLVPIYHIGNDTYVDEDNETITIEGSEGLTLNFAGSLNYNFSPLVSANLFYGSPFVTRDVQPEGLGRKYVTGFGLYFNL